MNDPNHEEHESYMEWWDGPYDPEDIDIDEINQDLQEIDQYEWRGESL